MIIQHNMTAQNANRQYGITNRSKSIWMERLSSGYRINRAADDAAGLAISEEMRAQIRGLSQGSSNSGDGINLLTEADGALNEVDEMLHRLKMLSVQAANCTNVDADRKAIQLEVDALLDEIDKISDDTEFNQQKLFKGGVEPLRDASGRVISWRDVPWTDFNLADVNLAEAPISNSNKRGNYLNLSARIDGGYSISNDYNWRLIYGQGSTSHTQVRVKYKGANGNQVTDNVDFSTLTFGDLESGTGSNEWVRKCTYDGGEYKLGITQKITLVQARDADYKYYDISYSVKNLSSKNMTMDFMFDCDTAFGGSIGGDHDEAYYQNGNRLTTTGFLDVDAGSFSINRLSHQNAMPFSEKVTWEDGDDGPSKVALGRWPGDRAWSQMDHESSFSGQSTGSNTYSNDLLFNLIWSDKELNAGSEQTMGFKYGIVPTSENNDMPSDTVVSGETMVHVPRKHLWIQSGANTLNGLDIVIGEMNTDILGIGRLDVSSTLSANESNAKIDKAVETINLQRALIGAQQNRLEHSIAVADLGAENLQVSESKIRDTDMAKAMVENAKLDILMQAGQSMIAQANQSTQGIVQLLR